jgi:hypothetical protein
VGRSPSPTPPLIRAFEIRVCGSGFHR